MTLPTAFTRSELTACSTSRIRCLCSADDQVPVRVATEIGTDELTLGDQFEPPSPDVAKSSRDETSSEPLPLEGGVDFRVNQDDDAGLGPVSDEASPLLAEPELVPLVLGVVDDARHDVAHGIHATPIANSTYGSLNASSLLLACPSRSRASLFGGPCGYGQLTVMRRCRGPRAAGRAPAMGPSPLPLRRLLLAGGGDELDQPSSNGLTTPPS